MLLKYHANGDATSPLMAQEAEEIRQTLDFERHNKQTGWLELGRTRANRWRVAVATMVFCERFQSGHLRVLMRWSGRL